MHVVVVESPAKAKTIGRYLGDGYRVFASYGHVSDLPAKDGSVRPEDGFAMTYVTARRANRVLSRIRAALKDAESLILATDPDREGEAIAWQVLTWLREKDAVGEKPVRRVDFHEITEHGVREAMAHPRDVDMDLVRAQQARRALDYLVGFHLSPVLWRKVPGSRSAGRVQSVALRLVCEREAEIESFVPQEYWTVDVQLEAAGGGSFTARPVLLDGSELDRLGIGTGTMAEDAARRIREGRFTVATVERREIRRNPVPPFNGAALPPGSYTLTATAYADSGGRGEERGSLEVSFTVAAGALGVTTPGPFTVAEGETAVAELAASDTGTGGTASWSIPEGTAGGADGAAFALTSEGVLTLVAAKDFEAPDDADGDGVYEVTVEAAVPATVMARAQSATAALLVTLANANEAPVVVASASPARVREGAEVTLDGSGSTDPDADDTLTYAWTQADDGAPRVVLSDANAAEVV